MNSISIQPQNLPEKLIWYYIIGNYLIYLLGVQYIFAPLLATFLTFYLFKKWWNQTEETTSDEKINISLSAWIWIVAALVIEVALIIGHLDFDLGAYTLTRSSLTWYRGWGIFALFILVGHLNIRPKLIYRSICILCLQSLFFLLLASLTIIFKMPNIVYTYPFKFLGGIVESYEVVFFYVIDEGKVRLQLFAPWAPALGMLGNLYFCIILQEIDKKWRYIGMIGAVAMIVSSVSRLALLCLPIVLLSVWLLTNFFRPWLLLTAGFVSTLLGITSPVMIDFMETFKEHFHKARAGSSAVRAALQRMAKEAWWNEARIWGHGALERRGPAYLGYMPIGTHHMWFGILYAHGIVGFLALVGALLWSFLVLLIKAQTDKNAMLGLQLILVMLLFTVAENLDTFAYVYWPALVILGIAFKPNATQNVKN